MKKEVIERICFNCNQFFPASMDEETEYGICLKDGDFEPFIDELLENSNYSSCQNLVNTKKFLGERKGCENYEEIESIEIEPREALGANTKAELEVLQKFQHFHLVFCPFVRCAILLSCRLSLNRVIA